MAKRKVETIDMTPTWMTACQIYLMVLENGSEEGKKIAREELMNMAKIAQGYVELLKKEKQGSKGIEGK